MLKIIIFGGLTAEILHLKLIEPWWQFLSHNTQEIFGDRR
jgi:hypothetical protein